MKKITSFRMMSGASVGLAAVAFFAVVVLANALLSGVRADLTENNLYTLSKGTKNIVSSLEEPITLRFFYSERLAANIPAIQSYAKRVRDLLGEYVALSGGKLKLEVINPEPFTDAEDMAVAYGIQGVPLNATGDKLYFGLAATGSTDQTHTLSFFDPQREAFLEYDLSRGIYEIAHPKHRTLGLLSTLPLGSESTASFMPQGGSAILMEQIRQMFDVKEIAKDAGVIPGDIDVLMVVHPKDLPEKTLFAIDQYVLKGGKALVMVDPMAETAGMGAYGGGAESSNPETLLAAWGVKMAQGMVVADRKAALKVNAGHGSRLYQVDNVTWLNLTADNFNKEDIVSSPLGQVRMISAGSLEKIEGKDMEFTPVFHSSTDATGIAALQIQFNSNPAELLRNFAPEGKEFVMAARLSGTPKSAFAAPPAEADETLKANFAQTASQPVNVFVVADTDMLQDRFWVQAQNFFGSTLLQVSADNGAFIVNVLDNLSGSSDLISLRSRGTAARSFTVVDALRREAEGRYQSKERELKERLTATEQKIRDLQNGQQQSAGAVLLLPEQQQALEQFRLEMVDIRKQLREVVHALRKDIEGLGSLLKFINIVLVPLAVALAAVFVLTRKNRHAGAKA